MARFILRPSYHSTAARLGVSGDVLMKIVETTEALRDEWPRPPGPEDQRRPRPPTSYCWARRVPGTSLAVLYLSGREGVTVLAVKSGP